jgi:hypothetical protein
VGSADVLGCVGAGASLDGVDDGGAGSADGVGSGVDGGALGSLAGVEGGVGSALDVGVSGSCANAPVVTPPNARATAVVKAPILSRARLTDLSDIWIPQRPL